MDRPVLAVIGPAHPTGRLDLRRALGIALDHQLAVHHDTYDQPIMVDALAAEHLSDGDRPEPGEDFVNRFVIHAAQAAVSRPASHGATKFLPDRS
jgi:hypothetical protein